MAQIIFPFPKYLTYPNVHYLRKNPISLQGFPVENSKTPTESNYFICSICLGIPRKPCYLQECGHLFCEYCIRKLYQTNPKASCPYCKTEFYLSEIISTENFPKWALGVWKSVQTKCTLECGFQADPLAVHHHEIYLCPRRHVKCPNLGCPYIGLIESIEKHYCECKFVYQLCLHCQLLISRKDFEKHDCVENLKQVLKGIPRLNTKQSLTENVISLNYDYLHLYRMSKKLHTSPSASPYLGETL